MDTFTLSGTCKNIYLVSASQNILLGAVVVGEFIFVSGIHLNVQQSDIGHLILLENNQLRTYFLIRHSMITFLKFIRLFLKDDNQIRIGDSEITKMAMVQCNNQGSIFFGSVSPLPVIFQERYNRSPKEEEGFISNTEIEIVESDLGNTQWINCDLSSFNKFSFYNSKILDCFLAGTTTPKYDQIIPSMENLTKEERMDQKRLFFSQIKSIFERQGDVARAAEVRAFEMDAYKNQLAIQRSSEIRTRKYTIPTRRSLNL